MKQKSQIDVTRDIEKSEFLDWVAFGNVAVFAETVMVSRLLRERQKERIRVSESLQSAVVILNIQLFRKNLLHPF